MRRMRDLPSKQPHIVLLFKDGVEVGKFQIPGTDPRFVKDRELFELAYEKLVRLQEYNGPNRRPEDPCPGSWDSFQINFYGMRITGNTRGEAMLIAA